MRGWLSLSLGLLTVGLAHSQTPDVSVITDLRWNTQFGDRKPQGRLYDMFARPSTITLQLILEGAYFIKVSERFVRIPNDADQSQLEFATFELPGLWRAGFVDAGFGRKWLIREHGWGGEVTTNLLIDDLPIRLAAVDAGQRRARGVMGRLGGRIGISYAEGDHFAASASSLTSVRRPEQATGVGRGYEQMIGLDGTTRVGRVRGAFEFVQLRKGETALDPDESVLDLELSYIMGFLKPEFRLGYARTIDARTNHWRFEADWPIDLKFIVTGQARIDQGRTLVALGLRAKF